MPKKASLGISNLAAESSVHHMNPSETMNVACGRFLSVSSKRGWRDLVARVKGTYNDMEGSLSVLSTPGGIPAMFSGKGREIILMDDVTSERKFEMKGLFCGVVKMVMDMDGSSPSLEEEMTRR